MDEKEKSEVYFYKSRAQRELSIKDEACHHQLTLLLAKASVCADAAKWMRGPVGRMRQDDYDVDKFDLCLSMLDTSINALMQYAHADLRRFPPAEDVLFV